MLSEIVLNTRVVSFESRAPTNCGQCNKPLPIQWTDNRLKIEGALLQLHFCGLVCIMRYERARR